MEAASKLLDLPSCFLMVPSLSKPRYEGLGAVYGHRYLSINPSANQKQTLRGEEECGLALVMGVGILARTSIFLALSIYKGETL
ncbi:hypothetical protein DL95DRAFT_389842, partial [Leptodontidium sp. 2 PMI_412]